MTVRVLHILVKVTILGFLVQLQDNVVHREGDNPVYAISIRWWESVCPYQPTYEEQCA